MEIRQAAEELTMIANVNKEVLLVNPLEVPNIQILWTVREQIQSSV